MLISPLTPKFVSAEPTNNKLQQTDTTNVSSFGAVLVAASTQVSISTAAQQQAQGNILKSGGFSMRDTVSKMDDKTLNAFLKGMVCEEVAGKGDAAGGLLDITDWMNGGPLRYSNTGEPVTAESKAYFNLAEKQYQSQKISLFETEFSQGTPLLDIYDKLTDLTSQQPTRFLGMMGYLVKPT